MARQQSRQRRHPRPIPFEHLSARQHNHNSGCSADSTARDPASVNQIEENARRPSDTEAAFCLDESVWDGRPGGAHAPSRVVSSALAGNIGGRKGVRRGRRTRQPGAAVLPMGGTIQFGKRFSARRRKRQPGHRAPQPRPGHRSQSQFGLDEWGGVALNLCNMKTAWLILGVLFGLAVAG
jgi:hypothetical protein